MVTRGDHAGELKGHVSRLECCSPMFQLLQYYGKWQGFRERMGRLPGWARFLVGLAGLPGAILALLSLLALAISILALFIPARLMYRLVTWLAAPGHEKEIADPLVQGGFGPVPAATEVEPTQGVAVRVQEGVVTVEPVEEQPRPRRQIEVKIVE
jgi:hypothetical protein